MRWILLCILLLISLTLESTVTTLPLVLIVLFVVTLFFNSASVFFLSFICGLLLDTLTFQKLGISSSFFILFLTCVSLYERKFEIRSIPFVFVFSFIGSLLYCLIFASNYVVVEALISSFLAIALFFFLQQIEKGA